MKKFLLKVLLFFALVVVMDYAWGFVLSWLRIHAKGGSTANCEYIANRCKDDIIILGSSRATHHYVPQIIEDSLGMSCYNCGEEGNGVVLAYGRLLMLTNRYKPKLVLYELTPRFDYGTEDPNVKYLGYLRSYYGKEGIKDVFDEFDDNMSCIKMRSKMYQNTGRLLPFLLDNLIYRDNNKGYAPLYGHLNESIQHPKRQNKQEMAVDSLKLSYLEKVIVHCHTNQIPLYFLISPRYKTHNYNNSSYKAAFTLSQKYNVPIFNYIYCPDISENANFFQDEVHLNKKGAIVYTQLVVKEVLNKNY